jgi:hypothetical protein
MHQKADHFKKFISEIYLYRGGKDFLSKKIEFARPTLSNNETQAIDDGIFTLTIPAEGPQHPSFGNPPPMPSHQFTNCNINFQHTSALLRGSFHFNS